MNQLTHDGDGERHIELFAGAKTGLPIVISCTCDIGQTHTYGDWLARFRMEAFHRPASADADIPKTSPTPPNPARSIRS